MATTIDLPAWDVDDDAHLIVGSSNLSTPDTATELVLSFGSQPLRCYHFGVDGLGGGNITLPPGDPTAAAYVVIAYAEGSEAGDPTDWSPDEPDPTQFPFLMTESSRTSSDGHTLDPIPVGAYAGETVHDATHDLSYILAGLPANRLWLQSYAPVPVHVAYWAVRLSYPEIVGAPDAPRVRFTW